MIAIVGMAGRFAGAAGLEAYWEGLVRGVEHVRALGDEELAAAGVDVAALDARHVRRHGVLADVDLFAAEFFGMTPREAEATDPQHRFLLELAWEALEDAGHDPERSRGLVGVFASASASGYHLGRPRSGPVEVGSSIDHLATRISYKLNLRGPSMVVQTACSSSLTAVHVAVQSLLHGECDLALAGGVSIQVPQAGFPYQEGGIVSPDGRCRAFDAGANGTIGGSGAGLVVLERLDDAEAAGRRVYAVIRGTAVNNDGSGKVGFTAPSLAGQAEVIAEAHTVAGVEPRTITYVEGHGTGTVMGDPVEVKALTHAFRAGTADTGFCALGSVKTAVGHLDAAAGIAGLIKAVLAAHHRVIPPTLHFRTPNPECELETSPFTVNAEAVPWEPGDLPRRAGVSAFGVGGTNVHVVLEEAPPPAPAAPARPGHLLTLSARTPAALVRMAERLADHLERRGEDELPLADAAHTSRSGRAQLDHRAALVCADREGAVRALRGVRAPEAASRREPPVVFMVPGQGSQHAGMGRGLYEHEPAFRSWIDRCCRGLEPHLGLDLRPRLHARDEGPLDQTWLAQPALFVTAYAMAMTLVEWGVRPDAVIGHSLGEYVAACLAGVLPLEDALRLVAARGRLMQAAPGGAMSAVALDEERLAPLLPGALAIAAVNGPRECVVSGPEAAVAALEERLRAEGVWVGRLRTSHAFHSASQDGVVAPLVAEVGRVRLAPPRLPIASNLTGGWMTPEMATDPACWGRQVREPVRFAAALRTVAGDGGAVLVEVGPGATLSGLARRQTPGAAAVIATMRRAQETRSDREALLAALGRLWVAGVPVDWEAFGRPERRRLVTLPSYPFERRSYWIDQVAEQGPAAAAPRPAAHPRPASLPPAAAPASPAEERVAAVWEEVIGTAGIGSSDDFFELGGSSLSATQMVARLGDVFGVELPVAVVFERPTVAGVAAAIEELLLAEIEALPEHEVEALEVGDGR